MQFERAQPVGEDAPAEAVAEEARREETTESKPRSWWDYPATYSLVAVNLLVFALMFRSGPWMGLIARHQWGAVFTAQFDYETLIRFGGCRSEAVLNGEWWRLITAAFVHATILHIALNLWCLWNLGLFGEPLLGKPGLVIVYVLTGVAGNLLSLAFSVFARVDSMVVGASGAVFGIAGILIVLLSNKGLVKPGLDWKAIRGLRSQVILFAVANLVLGVAPNFAPMMSDSALQLLHLDPHNLPRIDNTAHLGGLLCGLLLGVPLFSQMTVGKREYRARQRVTFAAAALVMGLFGYAVAAFGRG